MAARQIGVQHLVIVGASGYIAKRGVPRSLADLKLHDCIVGRQQGNRVAWLLKQADGAIIRHAVSVKHEIQDFEMVRSGLSDRSPPSWRR